MVPSVLSSWFIISLSRVVFPPPFFATRATFCPLSREKERSSMIGRAAFCEVLDSEVSHSKSKRAKKSDFKFCYFLFYGFICLMPVGKKEGFCNTVDVGEKKKKEYCDSSDNVFYDRI